MKFSIVMPLYKQSLKFVSRAIYSILSQTYPNLELIICDNGNEDQEVLSLINEIKEIDNRVIYFKSEKNVGWPKGISLCLEKASGDFMGFIADDDYLEQSALDHVYREIRKNEPDVVWMGQTYDIFENGEFKTIATQVPQYKILTGGEEICKNLIAFFDDVYYNSMQHYVKMNLLRKYGINFYDNYLSDCGGMTKVLGVSEKMVILNEAPYHLTRNTSLTMGKYQKEYYSMFASQWNSMTDLFHRQKYYNNSVLKYVAQRFEQNHLGNISLLCNGAPCRNDLYQIISMSYNERFLEIEKTLSNREVAEMIYFYGREEYFGVLLKNLIILLNLAHSKGVSLEEVIEGSLYLGNFVLGLLDCINENFQITSQLTVDRLKKIIECINHTDNLSMFGYEAISKLRGTSDFKTGIIFDLIKIKQKYVFLEQELIKKYGNNRILNTKTMKDKFASIVCYCHNSEKSVPVFFDYIIKQEIDMKRVELIFVNNASTDNTYQCLLNYDKQFEDSVLIVNLEETIPQQEAFNIGCSYVGTEYTEIANASDWV